MNARTRERILHKYRDINVDYSFWDEYLIADFKEEMSDIGFEVYDVHWTGFWMQGSGASFSGCVDDFQRFSAAVGVELTMTENAYFKVYERHTHCMYSDDDLFFADPKYEHPLKQAAWLQACKQATASWEEFTERALKLCNDKAYDFYRRLEAEYEYQTSDEQVLETLYDNEHILEDELNEHERCEEADDLAE